jgi:hypothetical protein
MRVLLVAAVGVLTFPPAAAADVIRSGFNDAAGINADGGANGSPFNVGNVPLGGQGAGEPGWAGPWYATTGSSRVGPVAFEGDGAAAFFQDTAGAGRQLARAPTNPFSVNIRMMVPGEVTRDVIFRVYDSSVSDIFQAIAVQWVVGPDYTFSVLTGTEDACPTGACPYANTGLTLTPGVWADVGVLVDPVARTWRFGVDGVWYDGTMGFRGTPDRLDAIEFLNEIAAPNGAYLDAVVIDTDPLAATAVPEPTALVAVVAGLFGLWLRVRAGRYPV